MFSVRWRLLPSGGDLTAQSIIMPAITVAAAGTGVIARFTRAAMLDALHQPFVRAMQARGLTWPDVVRAHVMPNAAIPTVTMIGFLLGGLVAGADDHRRPCSPGQASAELIVTSVARRDLAVVQCIVLLISSTMDWPTWRSISYIWLDPRMRTGARPTHEPHAGSRGRRRWPAVIVLAFAWISL